MDMDNQGQSPSLRQAYTDLCEEMADWKTERKIENVKFYAGNIQRVTILHGREHTTRKSKCDVCLDPQETGIQNFFLTGKGCHKFHVCPACWDEIMRAAPMNVLIAAQVAA
jgi:hypothetical protein